MSRWAELSDEITRGREAVRRSDVGSYATQIRARLMKLAQLGRCDGTVQAWLHDDRALGEVSFTKNANGHDGRHPALIVRDASGSPAGVLSVQVIYDRRSAYLVKYTIALRLPAEGPSDWFARVDLDEPKGVGLCSHSLLHCHIGVNPESPASPNARVPLPWLAPWEALEWVLATWDPSLEPTPLTGWSLSQADRSKADEAQGKLRRAGYKAGVTVTSSATRPLFDVIGLSEVELDRAIRAIGGG